MPVCTATLICLLEKESDRSIWRGTLYQNLAECQVVPGLYKVDPHRIQGMTPDNIVGYISILYSPEIYHYGLTTFWSYDCTAPYKFSLKYCVARFPGFVSFIKLSAVQDISIFGHIAIFLSAIFNTLSQYDNASDKCLQYLLNKRLTENSWTVRSWKYLMMRKYPGGLKELYSIYYGKDHPFTKYAPTQF